MNDLVYMPGMPLEQPARVYVLTHPQWLAHKIGVTGSSSKQDRLHRFEADGWRLCGTWNIPSGAQALLVEESILSWWRNDLALWPFISRDLMPQGGWTETVDAEAIPLGELMRRTAEAVRQFGGEAPEGSETPRLPTTATPRKLSKYRPEQAVEMARDAGFEPKVPYPRRVDSQWPCVCRACGKESAPRLIGIIVGYRCRHCSYDSRMAHRRTPQDQADDRMREMLLEPLAPYVNNSTPRPYQCMKCGKEGTTRQSDLAKKKFKGCTTCSKKEGQAHRAVSAEQALAEMRAADLDPLGPYPGINVKWPSRCLRCGYEGNQRLSSVRRGHRCRSCGAKEARRRQAGESAGEAKQLDIMDE